jgi:hypothetical protein
MISFVLLLLMSMSSFATNTRVMTMGDNNTILLDEANIWEFPSRINDYPNVAVGEFGYSGNNFQDFGVHWQFDQDAPWILGTYFHNSDVIFPPTHPYGYGYPISHFPFTTLIFPFVDPVDPSSSLMSNQRIDLFYGRKVGVQQIPLGVRFSAVHSSQEDKVPGNVSKEAFAIYDLAVGLTVGGGLTDLALGFSLMTWTDEDTNPTDSSVYDESKPSGNYEFYGMGRRFFQLTPSYTAVPHVGFNVGKTEAEYYALNGGSDSLAETDKYTWFMFDLGVGLQFAPSNDAMAVIDFGIQYYKISGDFTTTGTTSATTDVNDKTLTIPYFKMGADLKVFNWMDVRLGSESFWDRNSFDAQSGATIFDDNSTNYASNNTFLGFGFHWGNLHVDTYTDPEVFLNGFNFISGQSSSFNYQISALYEIM